MKKIVITMPVYNDWDSLIKLLQEINLVITDFKDYSFECLIIDDASTLKKPKILKPSSFHSINIIKMKFNQGHARCIASSLRYLNSKKDFDYVIIMDCDGEDRPVEIEALINKINQEPNTSVVAKRIKRSEGLLFQLLYQIHKLITFFFTGKKINFGNYSCLTKKDCFEISNQSSLWSSFSGTLKKNINTLNEISSIRGSRYFGPSKMSIPSLILHSFSIIGVFKYTVFLRSIILTLLIIISINITGLAGYILISLITIFNIIILIISLRENKTLLLQSDKNILTVDEITH